MDPATLSTTLAEIVDSFESIRYDLITTIEDIPSDKPHKKALEDLFETVDNLGDETTFLFTTCTFNQEALKKTSVGGDIGKSIAECVEHLKTTVEGIAGISENLLDISWMREGILAKTINDNPSMITAINEGVELLEKSLVVILSLFQLWIDIEYKATTPVLALSLAILQEQITTLKRAAFTEPDAATDPTLLPLANAADSIHISLSTTHPAAAAVAKTIDVQLTAAARSIFHAKLVAGDYDGVKDLLELGIHPTAPGPFGVAPLQTAALMGFLDILTLLIEHGADVHARCGQNGETALLHAAVGGHLEIVKYLVEKGVDVDGVSVAHNVTAVISACEHGHVDIVRYLVAERKADLEILDWRGCSALKKALEGGHEDVVKLLREYGVEDNTPEGQDKSSGDVAGPANGSGDEARVVTRDGKLQLVLEREGETPVEVLSLHMERATLYERDRE
ncbi:ankyrin repeat-containing domain protein [Aspergillus crustosus]